MRWLIILLLCTVGCSGTTQEAVSVNTTAIYEQGFNDGVASVVCPECECPDIKWYKPTRTEVEVFIRQDDTQKLAKGNNCAELVRIITGKASALGWNVTIGAVYTSCGYGHEFALFNTSDDGILYVDPFTDIIYKQEIMKKGNSYPPAPCKITFVVENWRKGQL